MGKHGLEVPTGWALPGPTHPRDHFALYKLLLFHSIAKEYSNFTLILQMLVLAGVEIGEIQKRVCSFTHGRREHFWRNRGLAHEPSPGDGALSWAWKPPGFGVPRRCTQHQSLQESGPCANGLILQVLT